MAELKPAEKSLEDFLGDADQVSFHWAGCASHAIQK